MSNRISVFYRLGMARERKFLEEFRDRYSGIVVSAHIAAYHKNLISEFLRRNRIPFFVDPETHVLARNLKKIKKEDRIKKSFEKLATEYGNFISKIILQEDREISPDDFKENDAWNDNIFEEVAQCVLNFQKNLISADRQLSLFELMEMAEMQPDRTITKPLFLVTPYFYIERYGDDWYQISFKMAHHAKKFKGDSGLYVVVCISKGLLADASIIANIVRDYKDFDGFIVWVADFDELRDGVESLIGYQNLISALHTTKKPVYSLYGGYFSAIISKNLLSGFCAGICYSESKHIDAPTTVGGGKIRYYIPFIHAKVPVENAARFYADHPEEICNCVVCKEIRRNGMDKREVVKKFFEILGMSDEPSKKHYLIRRSEELESINRNTLNGLIEQINKEAADQKKLNLQTYGISNAHLDRWLEALKNGQTRCKGLHETK